MPPSLEEMGQELPAYEFVEMLGRGGMGAVYRARQPRLDRFVAVKILPIELNEDPTHFQRFEREARIMAQLKHPNIVAVYDFGETEAGRPYIVMEYIEGPNLDEAMRSGELTLEHLFAWIPRVCEALDYAHSQGVVHRDVKPSNVLLGAGNEVKVADFGLAKPSGEVYFDVTQLTRTNATVGTLDYIAPEALEGTGETDYRADIYALGVLIYEMITGSVPRGVWQPPSEQLPGLDPRFDELLGRALQRDHQRRLQRAGEISDILDRIGEGQEEVAAAPGELPARAVAEGGAVARAASAEAAGSGDSAERTWVPTPVTPPAARPVVAQDPHSRSAHSSQGTLASAAAFPEKRSKGWVPPLLGLGLAGALVFCVWLAREPLLGLLSGGEDAGGAVSRQSELDPGLGASPSPGSSTANQPLGASETSGAAPVIVDTGTEGEAPGDKPAPAPPAVAASDPAEVSAASARETPTKGQDLAPGQFVPRIAPWETGQAPSSQEGASQPSSSQSSEESGLPARGWPPPRPGGPGGPGVGPDGRRLPPHPPHGGPHPPRSGSGGPPPRN